MKTFRGCSVQMIDILNYHEHTFDSQMLTEL